VVAPQNLNGTQFHDHVSPHQLAIPGMEEHAHPWAGPAARGYMLDLEHSPNEHHLAAVDVSHPKYPTSSAELSWAKEGAKGYEPGEVTMVENFSTGGRGVVPHDPRAKGLAGALFHSAHYWNFGQSTVPVHSPERTYAGERFANKVRPDLKPDVWHLTGEGHSKEVRAPGKPDWASPEWPDKPDDLHPFEQQRTATRQAAAAKADAATAMQRAGHQRLFDTTKFKGRKR
jgi:hypothetical protein